MEKIKFGDLIKIGRHTLLCGDSSERAMLAPLFGDRLPVLMVTDPPYGVNFKVRDRKEPSTVLAQGTTLEELRIRNDHRASWSRAFYLSQARVAYIWHASTATDVALQAIRDGDYEPRQVIVWAKNRATLSRAAYHWKHESCVYAVRFGETANWKGDRKQTTLWEAEIPPGKDRIHPTQKPIDLYIRPTLNHTEKGDVIYDPFAGSGVIFAAAQETSRSAVGVEIEPIFCEKIIARMESQYQLKPRVIGNVFVPSAMA
ncbi:MAG TPA: DNA methyltransferase [Oligoflexus sp.]|uniref:DNA-methyltransferase n=1 Tax=Oligoflexus sp. TaxID=1971216 RepID=UPI002D80571F|nr:DNA methyltransferase [Oligoflexus sp.]HET9241522.1 DNA methyltransferase [Oligoflexus sp.]